MAYTTINKSTDHFNTKLYTGNGSTNAITGVGFRPDWLWIKDRGSTYYHYIQDAVRTSDNVIFSNGTDAAQDYPNAIQSFDTDGFTTGSQAATNNNGNNFVSWNWKAGGTAPAITYVVKVVSDSGNKYRFDDFGTSAVTLDLQEGGTYTFDQSDSSNSGHPLRFYTAADKTGGEYTTGVTTNGTPGSSGAYTRITVAASAPTLYYQCSNHAGMGGQANTNSLFGSSNFKGAVQSLVSANTTSGFSVSLVSNLNSNTFGHGLGVEPDVIFNKRTDDVANWRIYYKGITSGNSLFLNSTSGSSSESSRISSADATTVTVTGSGHGGNAGTGTAVFYCFANKTGFSSSGTYQGNGNADGTFVYTGFKPAWVLNKRVDSTGNWMLIDNKREGFNPDQDDLRPNLTNAEGQDETFDLLSNGFKVRTTSNDFGGGSGATYFYLAFAEAPLVGTNNIPCTAR